MRSFKSHKKEINNRIAEIRIQDNTREIQNSDNKNKSLWKIVNNRLGRNTKTKNEISIKVNENIINNKQEVCNIFANYFATSVENKLKNHFQNNLSKMCTISNQAMVNSIFIKPVTAEEIVSIITNMKNKYSVGIDEIPIRLLKFCKHSLSNTIAFIINLSIQLGQFPNALKLGKIIPLHKKDDPQLLHNYRPIILLCYMSKIAEKAIATRIYSYLEANMLFTNCQYGYRANRSTEVASLEFTQKIYNHIDNGKKVAGLFFDLTAAFDCVNIKFMELKLETLGIRGNILNWLMSYLENRKIIVSLDSYISEIYNVDIGVGQGSIIGPLLFLIFVNDLPAYVTEGEIFMYADDTSVIINASCIVELEQKANAVITQFENWCQKNSLIININKTVFIYFSPTISKTTPNINYVSTSTTTKFLGTIIDSTLSFTQQIDCLCGKLAKCTFALLNIKNEVNRNGLVTAYYSLVYSVLNYNIMIWGQSNDVDRVFVMQKRIIRIIFNLQFRQSCRETFKKFEILTVPCIYIFKLACFVYKNSDLFHLNNDIHNYNTRSAREIHINNYNLSKFRKSPYFAGSLIFNKLPIQIKAINRFQLFRKTLKRFLTEHCFYSLKEFHDFNVVN